MTQTIQLSNSGTAEFNAEYIRINDKRAKRLFWVSIISSVALIPMQFVILAQHNYDFSEPVTWIFTFCLLALVIGTPIRVFRTSWEEVVYLDEVKSAKVEPGLLHAKLVLKLKNGKRRRILGKWEQAKEFRAYIETNLT